MSTPSFPLFPTLPTELRLKIWLQHHHNTPPQILHIYTNCFRDANQEDYYLGIGSNGSLNLETCSAWLHQFTPIRPVPSILHINSEARSVTLPFYQLGFQFKNNAKRPRFLPKTCEHLNVVAAGERNFYYNPQRDFLHYQHVPDSIASVHPVSGELTYVSTLQNTAAMWYPEATTLQPPRFISVTFEMLLHWLGPLSRKPDLSQTVLLGVVIEKDPRHSDYQSLAWRDHQIRIADTDSWEESKVYLEGKIADVVMGGVWKGGSRPRFGAFRVSVCRTLGEVEGVIEGWGEGEGGGQALEELGKGVVAEEEEGEACVVQ